MTNDLSPLRRRVVLFVACAFAAAHLWQAAPASLSFSTLFAVEKDYPAPQGFAKALIEGAREEVSRRPWYRSAYYSGGYPPDSEGVCTDVIWRAFKFAGYDLKQMIDADIKKNRKAYPRAKKPDPNIDFRRVPNQTAFFRRRAETLTNSIDAENMDTWQPGDIVVFTNRDHIAILSDKRNKDGIPLLLHNQGPFAMENDAFMAWYERGIVAHFRFTP